MSGLGAQIRVSKNGNRIKGKLRIYSSGGELAKPTSFTWESVLSVQFCHSSYAIEVPENKTHFAFSPDLCCDRTYWAAV